ncbi:apolipoprotein A-I [Nematolebias whitei]|uniref:apolipoprotein A-I n=1 Tax=Nematolebias whitei TaxID=451745 RepID=UPI00189A3DD6|nr:apolipoprotein A-I [Nematolebias whitei]
MKFSLVASFLVLAVVYSSEARTLVKREGQSDVDRIAQLFKDMSTSLSSATQEMVETYMGDGRTRIQPLMEQVQAEASKLQQQVKPFISNMEEQVKPLSDSLQTQVKPLTDMMEKFLQEMLDQSKALLPPQ